MKIEALLKFLRDRRPKITLSADFIYSLLAGTLIILGLSYTVIKGITTANVPDYESATPGIMSMHVLEGKTLPIFYYGTAYRGALEVYLTAIVFKIFGVSTGALFLTPILFWVGFIIVNFFLVEKVFGRRHAFLATLFLSLPTQAVFNVLYRAWLSYPEILFFGTSILYLTVKILKDREAGKQICINDLRLLGLILGLGFWTDLSLGMYVIVAALVILVSGHVRIVVETIKDRRRLFNFLTPLIVILLPMILYNLFPTTIAKITNVTLPSTDRLQTIKFFFGNKQPLRTTLFWNLYSLLNFYKTPLPLLLGIQQNIGYYLISRVSKIYYAFFGLVFIWVLVRFNRVFKTVFSFKKLAFADALKFYALAIIAVNWGMYVAGPWGFVPGEINVRYILASLIGLSALMAEFLLWLLSKNLAAFIAAMFLIFYNLIYPEFGSHLDMALFKKIPRPENALVAKLEELNVKHICVDFITGQPVEFLTKRKILTSDSYLSARNIRYNLKIGGLEVKSNPVFVFSTKIPAPLGKDAPVKIFEMFLKKQKIGYEIHEVGKDYKIYLNFDKDPRPIMKASSQFPIWKK